MRRIVGAWVALGLATAACQSDKPAPSASNAAATAAGRVIEVSGAVTVAGKPLAKGDTVKATDTVETGADGNVVIELAHNSVNLVLGPNQHVRVDTSLAWKQPKAAGSAAEGNAESTSAGRHAERAAAGTVADTGGEEGKMGRKEPPTTPQTIVAGADGSASGANDFAKDDERASGKGADEGMIGAAGTGKGGLGLKGTGVGGGGGGGTTGLGGIGTIGKGGGGGTGQGYGNGTGTLRGKSDGNATVKLDTPIVTGSLASEIIVRVIKQNKNAFRYCFERSLSKNPDLKGAITVKFIIDKSGAVASANIERNTVSEPEVGACVVERFKKIQFPKPADGIVQVTYPLLFMPPE